MLPERCPTRTKTLPIRRRSPLRKQPRSGHGRGWIDTRDWILEYSRYPDNVPGSGTAPSRLIISMNDHIPGRFQLNELIVNVLLGQSESGAQDLGLADDPAVAVMNDHAERLLHSRAGIHGEHGPGVDQTGLPKPSKSYPLAGS